MHNAATVAGMAFANTYLGAAHSLSHEVASRFDVPVGLVAGVLISHIIRFNERDEAVRDGYAQVCSWFGLVGAPNVIMRVH